MCSSDLPAWATESLRSYYRLVDRVYVSFDADGRSWAGHQLRVEESISALRRADPDGKIVLLPGSHSDPLRPILTVETEQRQCALDAASAGCDWVLQLDTDEIMLSPKAFMAHLYLAESRSADAMHFPLRDFYQALGDDRYLEHCGRLWTYQSGYPGPVAIRHGSLLNHCRQVVAPHYRVDTKRHNTDPSHPRSAQVDGVVSPSQAIAHMSWVRSPELMREKARTSGYANAHDWDRELPLWTSRGQHPWCTVAATPFKQNPRERFRISTLDLA